MNLIKKLFLLLFLITSSLFAQNKTTITDNDFINPLGLTGNWIATISSPQTFISADGYTVLGGWRAQFSIIGNTLSIPIIPNAGSNPNPTYYIVSYSNANPGGTGGFTEDWCVPASGSVTRSSVICNGSFFSFPVLNIPNGGTGATTAQGASQNILGLSPVGTYYYGSNGVTNSWQVFTGSGGGTTNPAPPTNSIQMNLAGVFGAVPNLSVNPSTGDFTGGISLFLNTIRGFTYVDNSSGGYSWTENGSGGFSFVGKPVVSDTGFTAPQFCIATSCINVWPTGSGGGVTSVAMSATLGTLFSCIVNNPSTTASIVCTPATVPQNTVLAGPASGGTGAWSFQNAPTISAANMLNFPTLNQNTSGTAANLSGTPLLPTGTTANTGTAGTSDTTIANKAFVVNTIAKIANVETTIASGTQNANTCSSPATPITMTGIIITPVHTIINVGYTSSPAALTGWGSTGGMNVAAYALSANNADYVLCNPTAGNITYSAITVVLSAK